jgi:hypothetical protein
MAAGVIILVVITGASVVGSFISYKILREPIANLIKGITYYYRLRKITKKIEKFILKRDRKNLKIQFNKLNNFDSNYLTNKVGRYYKLYNIDDNILKFDTLFNEFYGIEKTEDKLRRYARENSITLTNADGNVLDL